MCMINEISAMWYFYDTQLFMMNHTTMSLVLNFLCNTVLYIVFFYL